jgi:hypothetical protein
MKLIYAIVSVWVGQYAFKFLFIRLVVKLVFIFAFLNILDIMRLSLPE